MQTNEAVARIKRIERIVHALGAKALYLFGSTARNEATSTSDVDIFIDRDPTKPFGLNQFADLEELLSETLEAPVDLATRAMLHPAMRHEIEATAVRVL